MIASLVVSIINYRTADLTIGAARSVLDDLGNRDARVVIVDNASGDGFLAEAIAGWVEDTADPRVMLVRSATNSGFSDGHNQGMAVVPEAAFYLILNSDALLRRGFFDAMLAATEAHPEAGLFAPGLEDADGTRQQSFFRFHGLASEVIRGAGSGPVTRLLRRHVVALPVEPDPREIEWASFACILLRGSMVREIGPMDAGYFLYFEDAEYTLRARRAGWGLVPVTQARAVHFRGGSGPVKERQAARKRLPAYYWRSRTRFLRQAHGPFGPLLANLGWSAGWLIGRTRYLIGREVPQFPDGEWRDIWTGILRPLAPDRDHGK